MQKFIEQWRAMSSAERFQYVVEIWALVSVSVFMTLASLAFAGAPSQSVFLNSFGSLDAAKGFALACLLCALLAPLLMPLRKRLSIPLLRRLYIAAAVPLLFYMLVVIISAMGIGVALISYGFTFNLLALVGVTLYRDRRN